MKTPEAVENKSDSMSGHSRQNGQGAQAQSHKSRHREILLTRGMIALVDAEDYDRLCASRWSYQPNGKTGYAMRGVKGGDGKYRSQLMHRFILDTPTGTLVDHINGNGLDNRRANLRLCTASENCANREASGVSRNNKTGRWVSQITHQARTIWLGTFDTREAASAAYCSERVRLFGRFAGKVT